MLLSYYQSAGQNHGMKIANRSFGNVMQFRYLETITNPNLIKEEIKTRLDLGNASYHSVQNLWSSRPINVNIIMYETIIFPLVLYE
jgi:hypothetical protein